MFLFLNQGILESLGVGSGLGPESSRTADHQRRTREASLCAFCSALGEVEPFVLEKGQGLKDLGVGFRFCRVASF